MKRVIFYSWQSDLPNSTNRSLIENALKTAVNAIAIDLDIEPVIERDTQGVPGSPDIAQTIFSKIATSDLFVADITLVNPKSAERRTPNPNVLLELGYAMHACNSERIILVMNTAYGPIEQLPFDLRMRRVTTYESTPDGEKAGARKRLASILRDAITTALNAADKPQPSAIDRAELTTVLRHARFYKRVLRLIEDISKIPHHYITAIPRPQEYEQQRQALHTRFEDEYQAFDRDMAAANDMLQHQPSDENTRILAALRAVAASVQDLARWSNNRLDPIDLQRLPQTMKDEAEKAAENLSTLVGQRLAALRSS